MTKRIITRGNTAFFTFTFYDEDGEIAIVTSAKMQLTYAGASDFVTEVIDLTNSGTEWRTEWDTSKARPGWVNYHAHGYAAGGVNYGEDGRFRLKGNAANVDHDALPASGTASASALIADRDAGYE
jgi:hypothetical protein